ncbi:methyltransferase family protein [Neogemmobacter tilapiae]|uniref:Sodium:proton antiporter n=1 Tax=Neogemmobacter tilapiae TaxID=875041 RepID=A0A918TXK8_9RHOB|nr:isoprenylcysteine carboxylmethyltransferase family protein [Gemmobacter tilapiae]GHC66226.1 sodium:proton antiporter [Gemmobacter tilapiae]
MTANLTAKTVKPFNQRIRIWGLRLFFLAAVPLILFTRSAWGESDWQFGVMEVSGVFLIIAGVLGRFWAILYIGALKNRGVMQEGPYSICRHPLYLFSTIGVFGFGFMLGSLTLAAGLGLSVLMILQATASREERFLRSEFGAEYQAYAARVPRILPKPSLFTTGPVIEVSVAALRVNFADALVFLAFIPLAEMMEAVHEKGWLPSVVLY